MIFPAHISIILPTYNGEAYLSQAIESCLQQSYSDFELIIVNDCSTDSSSEIAETYKKQDSRIKVIYNTTNQKLPASLNIGHRAAKGNFLTWTSDDNVLKPNFLMFLVDAISTLDVDVVYSNYDIIHDDGMLKREHLAGSVSHLLFGNTIGASFLYRREVFEKLGGYNETFHTVEDYDFWMRAAVLFKFHSIGKNLYQYRLHGKSLTWEIQEQCVPKSLYKEKLNAVFENLGVKLNWHPVTIQFFQMENDFGRFSYFKNNFETIEKDLHKFQQKVSENRIETAFKKLDEILRNILKTENKNLTFPLLIWILKYEPGIFFNKTYSRWETIKLLSKFF
jgi:glycosyltransferase involved in cell wall biosynthesis